MSMPMLLTEDDFRQCVKEATILSLADDNQVGEEEFAGHLARIIEVRNNDLLDAEWMRRKGLRTGDLSETSGVFVDADQIARINAGYVSAQANAVAERISRNKKIVLFVAGAAVACAGFLASGGAASALVPALLPVARLVIAELNAKDDDPLEFPEFTFPQTIQKTNITGINVAVSRGALPEASGIDAVSTAHAPHGNPHHVPHHVPQDEIPPGHTKPGHHAKPPHHEPPDTHHTHH